MVEHDGPTRRTVLEAAGAVSFGGVASLFGETSAARVVPESADGDAFDVERQGVESVFPQSVASGGPTPSGALLWTRLAPDVHDPETPLNVEVANDENFEDVVYRGRVPAARVGRTGDYTVTVDVNGELGPDSHYFYRFVYDGDASRMGRCRTLPRPDASPDRLRLAVVSCNSYLDGYFGAFGRVAERDADLLVHLGDLIYEHAGDGIGDRRIELPSGGPVATELADFRQLYRTYRTDEHLQRALERHTLVHVWDDHEIVDNRWWDYERDAPATDTQEWGDDPEFMRQLYAAAIRAYVEYVPVRVKYQPENDGGLDPTALREQFQLYRSLQFGDLAELFVTDERLYRSTPPGAGGETVDVPTDRVAENPGRTMLGDEQRRWFLDEVTGSDARWKLWINEVLVSPLRFVRDGSVRVNADSWDGYPRERERILSRVGNADVENFVALTGDLHSYLASYLRTAYGEAQSVGEILGEDEGERTGVELMAPAVTSDNLSTAGYSDTAIAAVGAANSHVEWFDSRHWGYVVVDLGRDELVYSAYAVDRSVDSADAPERLLRRYRVPAGTTELRRLDDTEAERTSESETTQE